MVLVSTETPYTVAEERFGPKKKSWKEEKVTRAGEEHNTIL
jgi:hypothetical protein